MQSSHPQDQASHSRKFPLSGNRILKFALVVYIGAIIPTVAVLVSGVRLGADPTAPVARSTQRSHEMNSEPDKIRNLQEQPEVAERRFARCLAEKSAETAARLEAQGEIAHRDRILFSTPVSETENVTPFGRREILNFRREHGIEQICTDLSQHGD
jgi:hypothetical protein